MNDRTTEAAGLDALRREIDRIDDQMLDLLVDRAKVVEQVGATKRAAGETVGIFLRPGREMDILRRLVERARGGSFPKGVIVRMWREMFAALVAIQGPMSVAVFMPTRGAGYLEMARDAYGAYTTMVPYQTPGPVVRAVAAGEATVGVLPLPRLEDSDAWWSMLISEVADTPRIVTRLPFIGPGPGRGDGLEGLVIARLPQEDTGNDRTLVAFETGPDLSRQSLRMLVDAAGLPTLEVAATHAPAPEVRLHLVELQGCILADDERLARLRTDSQVMRAVVVGGYAVPFTPDELV